LNGLLLFSQATRQTTSKNIFPKEMDFFQKTRETPLKHPPHEIGLFHGKGSF
jgi:hypothetical protein